jgi:hypothetical protein
VVLPCSNSERSTFSYRLWDHTGLLPSLAQYSKSFYSQSLCCQCRFLSPILTTSRLISFPVATEMFQFTTCHLYCGFPRWELRTFKTQSVSGTTFRIITRPYLLGSQGIHKTPLLSSSSSMGIEPISQYNWITSISKVGFSV